MEIKLAYCTRSHQPQNKLHCSVFFGLFSKNQNPIVATLSVPCEYGVWGEGTLTKKAFLSVRLTPVFIYIHFS